MESGVLFPLTNSFPFFPLPFHRIVNTSITSPFFFYPHFFQRGEFFPLEKGGRGFLPLSILYVRFFPSFPIPKPNILYWDDKKPDTSTPSPPSIYQWTDFPCVSHISPLSFSPKHSHPYSLPFPGHNQASLKITSLRSRRGIVFPPIREQYFTF